MLLTAAESGTVWGKMARERRVSSCTSGVATMIRRERGQGAGRAITEPSSRWQQTTSPPRSAAARFSGWPSMAHPAASSFSMGCGPNIVSNRRKPAGTAARGEMIEGALDEVFAVQFDIAKVEVEAAGTGLAALADTQVEEQADGKGKSVEAGAEVGNGSGDGNAGAASAEVRLHGSPDLGCGGWGAAGWNDRLGGLSYKVSLLLPSEAAPPAGTAGPFSRSESFN